MSCGQPVCQAVSGLGRWYSLSVMVYSHWVIMHLWSPQIGRVSSCKRRYSLTCGFNWMVHYCWTSHCTLLGYQCCPDPSLPLSPLSSSLSFLSLSKTGSLCTVLAVLKSAGILLLCLRSAGIKGGYHRIQPPFLPLAVNSHTPHQRADWPFGGITFHVLCGKGQKSLLPQISRIHQHQVGSYRWKDMWLFNVCHPSWL